MEGDSKSKAEVLKPSILTPSVKLFSCIYSENTESDRKRPSVRREMSSL